MRTAADVIVRPDNDALRIDRLRKRTSLSPRHIEGGKLALSQQKTMRAGAIGVVPDNVALRIDPIRFRIQESARYIDGGKLAPAQQKAMRIAAAVTVVPDNVTLRVDRIRFRLRAKGRRYIDGCELVGPTGSRHSRR